MARLIRETRHDILYLNSFWHPVFTVRPLLLRRLGLTPRRPVVIAPRGEFSEGAMELKRWKKTPHLAVSRVLSLYRDLTWQASSPHELADISKALSSTAERVMVAPDISELPEVAPYHERQKDRHLSGPLRICFVSRISRKKNLDFVLRVLAALKLPVVFDIYGPLTDPTYWQHCEEI